MPRTLLSLFQGKHGQGLKMPAATAALPHSPDKITAIVIGPEGKIKDTLPACFDRDLPRSPRNSIPRAFQS